MSNTNLGAGAVFVASLVVLSPAASASGVVCVYEDRDFRGARCCCDEDIPNFRDIRMHGAVSSIRVFGNTGGRVYEHAGFRGRSAVVEDHIPSPAPSLNHTFSSLQSLQRGRFRYERWDEREYPRGRSERRGAYREQESERNYPGESFAAQGAAVCVYQHRDYQGWERCFIGGHPSLIDLGKDNQIAPVRIVGNVKAHLFGRINYPGRKTMFVDAEPLLERGDNDTFSSLAITSR